MSIFCYLLIICTIKGRNHMCVCVCSVLSDSLQLHGLEPTRLLCPWDFPDKDSRVGFHSTGGEEIPFLVKRRNYPRQLNQGVRIFGKPSQNSVYHTCAILSHFSCVWLFVTLWTIAHQAPLSMEFSRILEWVAIFSSRGSSQHRDGTCIYWGSCIADRHFYHWAIGKPTHTLP